MKVDKEKSTEEKLNTVMHLLDPEPSLPNSQLNTMAVKELALYSSTYTAL